MVPMLKSLHRRPKWGGGMGSAPPPPGSADVVPCVNRNVVAKGAPFNKTFSCVFICQPDVRDNTMAFFHYTRQWGFGFRELLSRSSVCMLAVLNKVASHVD